VSLQFNLSHSDGLAVYAISTQRRVGVDIEHVRPIRHAGLLREFSPSERSTIHLLPEDEQRKAFFRLWTCKEAYVKANGQGMSLPFGSFDLGGTVDQSARMVRLQDPSSGSTFWTFIDLPIDDPDRPEWTATVAAEGKRIDLRRWSWCRRARVMS